MTTKINIQFTTAAYKHINRIVNANKGCACRLSMKKKGCSGYLYELTTITEKEMQDNFKEKHILLPKPENPSFQTTIDIFIDKHWLDKLNGLLVDYQATQNMSNKLIYRNENEVGRCGCEESVYFGEEST